MNPIKNLFKFNRGKVKSQTNFIGRTSIGAVNPGRMMGLDLHSDTYASAYPSIRAISNEYMTVLPKAIDGNGKPVKSNILDALYHPNQKDSVVSFNEKLATSTQWRIAEPVYASPLMSVMSNPSQVNAAA